MASKASKMESKYEVHAARVAEAKVNAQKWTENRSAAIQRVAWIESQFKNGHDDVTAVEYAEALAGRDRAKMLADFGAVQLMKRVNAAAPWDPILAESVARTLAPVFAGVEVQVVEAQPSASESDVPVLHLWQRNGGTAQHNGSTSGTVYARFTAPGWAAGLNRQELDNALANAAEGTMSLHNFDGREFTIDVGGVFPLLPTLSGTPTEKGVLSVAEALASRVTDSTALHDGNGDPRLAMGKGTDGWPRLTPVTQVVARATGAEVTSVKVSAGKRVVLAEVHVEAWSNPLWEGEVSNPGAYVERETRWLEGRAFGGLGRVTEVQVVKGSPETGKASVTTFKLTAESTVA